ncbi:hypothetical protein ACOSP7_007786 [Xanthoceras sorbifolium]
MTSVSSANDEAASNSHGKIITSLGCHSSNIDDQDVKMKRVVDCIYMDPQLYEARLHMNSVSDSQGEIITTTDGYFEPFNIIQKEMSLIITPDKNTTLYIHIRSRGIQFTTTRYCEKVTV